MRANHVAIDQTLEKAERLLGQGNPKAAADAAQAVLLAVPKNTRANWIAAMAYRQMGNSEASLARFKSAAEGTKDFRVWREFVTELLRAGQKGRARKAASKAPMRGPEKKALLDLAKTGLQANKVASGGADEAALNTVKALLQSGDLVGAEAAATDLLNAHPTSAFLHNALGIIAMSRGAAVEAEERFLKTLELSPQFAGASGNLGLAYLSQDKTEDAIKVLRQAVIENPKSLEIQTNLASAYLKAGANPKAAEHARLALQLSADDPEALQILAMAATNQRQFDEALGALEKLRNMQPDDPAILTRTLIALEASGQNDEALAFAERHKDDVPDVAWRRAQLLAQLGQIEDAAMALQDFIGRYPDDENAYMTYSKLRKWSLDDPVLSALEAFTAKGEGASNKGLGFYALAKAYMDLGKDAEAADMLHRANKVHAQSTTQPFSEEVAKSDTAKLISIWDREAIEGLTGLGAVTVAPIFIIGMPRSGSTLLDQILCAHPELSGVGEDSVVAEHVPVQIEPVADAIKAASRDGAEALRRAADSGTNIVDKYLSNFLRVGALATVFPKARFLETTRDPRSIALSIYSNAMQVDGHPYSTSLTDIAAYFLQYETLMAHWHDVLGPRIRKVNYETLVDDPEPAIRDIIAWAGLPWHDDCLKPNSVARRVKTISYAQVREEISTKSVDRWRRFEDALTPFTDALKAVGRL